MPGDDPRGGEVQLTHDHAPARAIEYTDIRRFRLVVIDGANATKVESRGTRCSIGSHPSNDLVLDDPTVSRLAYGGARSGVAGGDPVPGPQREGETDGADRDDRDDRDDEYDGHDG